MAYTTSDLENIEKAIIALGTGKRSTKFVIDGNVVAYAVVELPQLRALRNEVATELQDAESDQSETVAFQVFGSKGY